MHEANDTVNTGVARIEEKTNPSAAAACAEKQQEGQKKAHASPSLRILRPFGPTSRNLSGKRKTKRDKSIDQLPFIRHNEIEHQPATAWGGALE